MSQRLPGVGASRPLGAGAASESQASPARPPPLPRARLQIRAGLEPLLPRRGAAWRSVLRGAGS